MSGMNLCSCSSLRPLAHKRLSRQALKAASHVQTTTRSYRFNRLSGQTFSSTLICKAARQSASTITGPSTRHARCHCSTHSSIGSPQDSHQAGRDHEKLDSPSEPQQARATDFLDVDSLQESSSVYASPQTSAYQSVTPSFQEKQKQGDLDPSFWAHKPYWCQPWSILLTGTLFVAGARLLFHGSNIITGLAAVPILVWWYLFLVLVPSNYRSFVEEE